MHKAPRFRATRHADSVLSRAGTSVSRACTRKYYLYVRRRGEVKSGEKDNARVERAAAAAAAAAAVCFTHCVPLLRCSSNARKAGLERNRSAFPSCFVRTLTVHASFRYQVGKIPLINCCRRLGDKCRGGRFRTWRN